MNTAIDWYGSTLRRPSLITPHRVNNTFISDLIEAIFLRCRLEICCLVNCYCNNLEIKLVFTTFKLRNIFSVRDFVPTDLCSCVIYKFTCACCNACYIGETSCHFSTRLREHLCSDKSSYIFKLLLSSERCRQSCSTDRFETLDSAYTNFQLKLMEAMDIN